MQKNEGESYCNRISYSGEVPCSSDRETDRLSVSRFSYNLPSCPPFAHAFNSGLTPISTVCGREYNSRTVRQAAIRDRLRFASQNAFHDEKDVGLM